MTWTRSWALSAVLLMACEARSAPERRDPTPEGATRRWVEVRAASDRTSLLVVAIAAVLLFLLQLGQAMQIDRRVRALADHMARIREEDFDGVLPADRARDVIGQLRDSVADATDRLKAARVAQDRLVADAAHELRTPLATMRATIDVTLRRERSSEELRESLVNARDEVDRLAILATELLDLASLRGGVPVWEKFDLQPLVERAAESSRPLATPRHIVIATECEPLVLLGSAREIRQAVDNLLANALAFSPDDSEIRVQLRSEQSAVQIIVSDNGPGVPESERTAIFEPFHRLVRNRPGAGLGLAIVRDVARRHGGSVSVRDVRGAGAQFVLELKVGARRS